MTKMKTKAFLSALVLGSSLTIVSCEDIGLDDFSDTESNVLVDYLHAEAILSHVYRHIDFITKDSTLAATDSAAVLDAMAYRMGNVLTIDYDLGKTSVDGFIRKGQIIVVENGKYTTPGSSSQVSFKNLDINSSPVSGTLSIMHNSMGNFTVTATNFSAKPGFPITASKTVNWIQGFGTPTGVDDIFEYSGQADHKQNGTDLNTTVGEALLIEDSCTYKLVGGEIDFTLSIDTIDEPSSGKIDFLKSDGCNNIVKMNVKKGEAEVTLTKQFTGF